MSRKITTKARKKRRTGIWWKPSDVKLVGDVLHWSRVGFASKYEIGIRLGSSRSIRIRIAAKVSGNGELRWKLPDNTDLPKEYDLFVRAGNKAGFGEWSVGVKFAVEKPEKLPAETPSLLPVPVPREPKKIPYHPETIPIVTVLPGRLTRPNYRAAFVAAGAIALIICGIFFLERAHSAGVARDESEELSETLTSDINDPVDVSYVDWEKDNPTVTLPAALTEQYDDTPLIMDGTPLPDPGRFIGSERETSDIEMAPGTSKRFVTPEKCLVEIIFPYGGKSLIRMYTKTFMDEKFIDDDCRSWSSDSKTLLFTNIGTETVSFYIRVTREM